MYKDINLNKTNLKKNKKNQEGHDEPEVLPHQLQFFLSFFSETDRPLKISNSNSIIRTGINSQLSSKFSCIVHFALELLVFECLNSPYLVLSCI